MVTLKDMRRVIGEALMSMAALVILLAVLAALDPRIREHAKSVLLHKDGDDTWHVRLPWQVVRDKFGHLMEATEHLPVRYRVRQFPDRGQLHALAETAAL